MRFLSEICLHVSDSRRAWTEAIDRQLLHRRPALGATRAGIFAALFNQGASLVIAGLVLGLGAGIWLRCVVSTFVFGITAGDPAT